MAMQKRFLSLLLCALFMLGACQGALAQDATGTASTAPKQNSKSDTPDNAEIDTRDPKIDGVIVLKMRTNPDFARHIDVQAEDDAEYTINGFQYIPQKNNRTGNIMISTQTVAAFVQATELLATLDASEIMVDRDIVKYTDPQKGYIQRANIVKSKLNNYHALLAKNDKSILDIRFLMFDEKQKREPLPEVHIVEFKKQDPPLPEEPE